MKNFGLAFAHSPWWLLLLIPAVIFTLIPYFKLSKRYRRTRNRITSIVLHLLVMLFTTCLLAGMTITYEVPNENNEIILLVDVSDTEETAADKRDEFIQLVLSSGQYDNYKIGVVKFGFDQVYAVPMTYDIDSIYNKYIEAEHPDVTATNIAAALTYTEGLFENPETAKIVLITDGKETDGTAQDVVHSIATQRIKLDIAYVSSSYEKGDIQLVGATLPDYYVRAKENCTIQVAFYSQKQMPATLVMKDNGEEVATLAIDAVFGNQTVSIPYAFQKTGLHELSFTIDATVDTVSANNELCVYYNLEFFNKLLVVERTEGDSDAFIAAINDAGEYQITQMCITDEDFPNTLEALCQFDQVILNNISNQELCSVDTGDVNVTFDRILQTYVKECGGGLFTAGGLDENGEVNAYNKDTLGGSIYQDMMPIQVINYTPPVGVFVIIDTSGSMGGNDEYGKSKLDWAIAGAESCLESLTDRDYLGVMTLASTHGEVLDLTACTQREFIKAQIKSIQESNGGTIFTDAIIAAAEKLQTLDNVARRHIVIVSDGAVPESEKQTYPKYISGYYQNSGVTLSVVGVDMKPGSQEAVDMQIAVDAGHGKLHMASNTQELVQKLREDLTAPEIKDVNFDEPFHPVIYSKADLSPIVRDLELVVPVEGEEQEDVLTGKRVNVYLGGFFGGKIKSDAQLILTGDYEVPIYAQRKYGEGMVGSFMCDISGAADSWSAEFISNINGKTFLKNAINYLMPTEAIVDQQIRVMLSEDNYTNKLSIISAVNVDEGEYITGQLIEILDGVEETVVSLNEITKGNREELAERASYVTLPLTKENKYTRCDFIVRDKGIYKIVLTKYDKDGKELSSYVSYKDFSYSEEYDTTIVISNLEAKKNLSALAEGGNGVLIEDLEDPYEVFQGFLTELSRSFDPRFLFMILAIVLFLLDIVVRKFKFKWPHEIIRDYKNKKNSQ